MNKPMIGLPLCRWQLTDRDIGWFHLVGEKYIHAVTGYGAFPLMIPAFGDDLDMDTVLDSVSGILFGGSLSNVHPSFYGDAHPGLGLADKPRDETVLRLMRACIERGIPFLGICRGVQEMNVLYGGTLHREVHAVAGRLDHREVTDVPDDVAYGPMHNVTLTAGGVLHTLLGERQIKVNSLHGQGIDRLGEGLQIEAVAEDGQIEAVSVIGAKAFAVGVQWHPEYRYWEKADYHALLGAFHQAAREYQVRKVENCREAARA
jgi:putative glutamine amidotransferase